ncbi:unnamed protein product [Paramecium primaurelia]|uniref:Uncharacterized protein n=1 Tax=Paramecium primaurelia TaxID=5886 RepID=A0A8S1QJ64_PARPR|nr:unnamed protein product [Paramecium primaurelia]
MFQSKIKVEISNLQCNKHFGNPYLQIKIDKGCNGIERLMCSECIADQRGVYNVMSIVEASERIQNLKSQQQQQIVDFIKSQKQMLEKLREKTNSLQSKIYELFSSLNQKFDDYSVELDNLVAEYNFCDLLKEINFLFESPNQIIYQQFLIDSERIQAMNRIYSSKVNNLTLTLKSIIADWNVQNEFDEKFNEISTQINDNRINKNHSILTKIQEVKQQQSCWAIAFNKSNSIMAAGCEENIKIWNFQDNKLIDSGIVLKGHSDYVQCLVFSKYHDWFVSGGLDEKIICWKQINIQKWQGNQFINTGQGIIQCLVLKSAVDLIISSHDSKIKVWNLNIECNIISFKQSLDMHKSTVQSIFVNENQHFQYQVLQIIKLFYGQRNLHKNSLTNVLSIKLQMIVEIELDLFRIQLLFGNRKNKEFYIYLILRMESLLKNLNCKLNQKQKINKIELYFFHLFLVKKYIYLKTSQICMYFEEIQ